MPSTKYMGLNYATHFLKSMGSVIFSNTGLNKSAILHDEMRFIHYSLQIKQNIYYKGISDKIL